MCRLRELKMEVYRMFLLSPAQHGSFISQKPTSFAISRCSCRHMELIMETGYILVTLQVPGSKGVFDKVAVGNVGFRFPVGCRLT